MPPITQIWKQLCLLVLSWVYSGAYLLAYFHGHIQTHIQGHSQVICRHIFRGIFKGIFRGIFRAYADTYSGAYSGAYLTQAMSKVIHMEIDESCEPIITNYNRSSIGFANQLLMMPTKPSHITIHNLIFG